MRPLTLHSVKTRDEQLVEDERDARCSVNEQIYRRDHGEDDGWCVIPSDVMFDERLPQ